MTGRINIPPGAVAHIMEAVERGQKDDKRDVATQVTRASITYGDTQPGGTGGPPSGSNIWHRFYVKGTGTEDGIKTGHYVDGSRTAFDLEDASGDPIYPVSESITVTLNGMVVRYGAGLDYTLSGNTLTFNVAPPNGWELYGNCQID